MGYSFRRDSKMVIVNPPDSGAYHPKDVDWRMPEIWVFNEEQKKFTRKQ
jgi:hypothetical protein